MSGYHLLILICMLSISWLTALIFSPIVVKIANRFRILDPLPFPLHFFILPFASFFTFRFGIFFKSHSGLGF